MAKDAHGHGSESRGKVTYDYEGNHDIGNILAFERDKVAAAALAQGHPKSGAVPVNAGATGRGGPTPPARYNVIAKGLGHETADNIRSFTQKYGGPKKRSQL